VDQKWPDLGLTQKDLNLLSSAQVNSVDALTAAMESTAGQAFSRGLFGMSGLRFGSLAEIEKMDNGQLPNVFLTGGGTAGTSGLSRRMR
jgi:hypothetical protein